MNVNPGLKRAKAARWTVIEPGPRDIQLDLDGLDAVKRFGIQIAILTDAGLLDGWKIRSSPSKTKDHLHVILTRPISLLWSAEYRVLFAALLGSDLRREAYNWIRLQTGRRVPVALFAKGSRHAQALQAQANQLVTALLSPTE